MDWVNRHKGRVPDLRFKPEHMRFQIQAALDTLHIHHPAESQSRRPFFVCRMHNNHNNHNNNKIIILIHDATRLKSAGSWGIVSVGEADALRTVPRLPRALAASN